MSNTEWSVEEVVRGTEVQFKKIAGRMLDGREWNEVPDGV